MHAPGTNEAIKIGQHVQSYSFALGDSVTSGLNAKWSKVSPALLPLCPTPPLPASFVPLPWWLLTYLRWRASGDDADYRSSKGTK